MNILHIGNFTRGWDGSICDELHISNALRELGHDVDDWQREKTIEGGYKERLKSKYDFILLAQWDGYLWDFLDHLKPRGKVVYWCYDYQTDGQEWHERLIKGADLYLSKRIADSKYPNWQWLSQDFAPEFLDRADNGKKDIDVLFTGSYLDWAEERNKTIEEVGKHFNLVIHSVNQWPQGNDGPVMDKDLPALYDRARIVLSIDHTIEAGYWSDRVAQALCCGAFVLHRYQPMCETVFKNHVAYFYNVEDCIKKLSALLTPHTIAMRAEVARKGYKYAQENLKVKNRVTDLLAIVGSIL